MSQNNMNLYVITYTERTGRDYQLSTHEIYVVASNIKIVIDKYSELTITNIERVRGSLEVLK